MRREYRLRLVTGYGSRKVSEGPKILPWLSKSVPSPAQPNNLMSCLGRLRLLRHDLLHRRPVQQTLHPPTIVGVLSLDIDGVLPANPAHHVMPRDKGQVCERGLVADQVLPLCQPTVQDAHDALHLLDIALAGAGELLVVEMGEP